MTSLDQVHTYAWDATGMMTEQVDGSARHDYLYNADGERIAMYDVPAQSWTWEARDLGGKVLREYTSHDAGTNFASANWQWTRDYVYRNGQLLAAVVQPLDPLGTPAGGPITEHFHLDHLGTPRLITDGAGIKLGFHTYYPFGAEQTPTASETAVDAMKFTGHELDGLAGDMHTLDYMHARFYGAAMGRFLSIDPLRGLFSRYSYALNRPTSLIDPQGLDSCPAGSEGKTCFTYVLHDDKWYAESNAEFSRMAQRPHVTHSPAAKTNERRHDVIHYTAFSVGVAIPNPVTQTFVGPTFQFTYDAYGHTYFSLGLGVGKSPTLVGGSLMTGHMLGPTPSQSEINQFITGWGANVTASPGGPAGGVTWGGPGNGFAVETGGASPQLGVSGGYAWELPFQFPEYPNGG
jgi:RHS repeat-associated protein